MRRFYFKLAVPVLTFYDEEETAAAEAAAAEATAAEAAAAEAAAKKKTEGEAGKTFTQEEVNKMLADDRRRNKTATEKHIRDLEELRKSKTLTEKDRDHLTTRIEELNNTLLTKEQLAQKEREKLEGTHKQVVSTLTAERDTWQNRFVTSTINTAIISEAVRQEAFDPDALIAMLGSKTRLVEDTDDDGKGLNKFTPKVKFDDVDAEQKPIVLELTVEQAIKRMKDLPRFAYLFKSTAVGGLGAAPTLPGGTKPDIKRMTPAQYREHRKKEGLARKS